MDNPVELDTFKKHKRSNVLKSLVAYAKYTGTYSEFKQRLKDYGIRWGKTTDSIGSFLRMMNNNSSDALKWYREALQVLRPNEQTLLRFALVTGLRKSEAIQAFNLVIRLHEENRLKEYYNEELQTLEHFRFRELFLRKTKNVFISFVPKSLIEEIVTSSPVTYESIRKRLQRKHIPVRLMELRNHFATFMVRHGLIREEVDLLQGRIPANVFIRHYWTPSLRDLRDRKLRAARTLFHKS
ncbi:MAG: integrase [Candidatus Thorarchaeota archaeon]